MPDTSNGASGASAPRVSVIIPAYRVSDVIDDTLASVFSQTYSDYEVILVNDGCPDTAGLEAAIAPYRERIRYLVQENGGPSVARNTGIRAARGTLIAQLDGDDQWLPGFLEYQVGFLDRHPEVDVAFTDAVFMGGPHDGRRFFETNGTAGPITLQSLLRLEVVVLTSSMVGRRACLESAGLYDESLHTVEDFDLWLRLVAAGAQLAYTREVLVRYRRSPHSLSSDEIQMLNDGIFTLDKASRMLRLSSEERVALEDGQIRMRSQLSYERGLSALRRGEAAVARREFANVKRWNSPVRLKALQVALRVAPRLAVSAYRHIRGE
jgi:glycosyltransferase involved in cell wall biosynthesis